MKPIRQEIINIPKLYDTILDHINKYTDQQTNNMWNTILVQVSEEIKEYIIQQLYDHYSNEQ